MKQPSTQKLRRRQLDRTFTTPIKLIDAPIFKRGYIREIREALGISSTQLAHLLNVSQPEIIRLEHAEQNNSITLKSLKKTAKALNSKLVYAIVPEISLEDSLATQAKKIATKIAERIEKNMALESQSTSTQERHQLIDEIANELINNMDKRLWENVT